MQRYHAYMSKQQAYLPKCFLLSSLVTGQMYHAQVCLLQDTCTFSPHASLDRPVCHSISYTSRLVPSKTCFSLTQFHVQYYFGSEMWVLDRLYNMLKQN